VDALAHKTNAAEADGEAVWSRRPDAGVKLATMLRITRATGAREPGPRGERGISVNTIARGMPVISAEPVVPAPCLLAARGPWVRLNHPAFPAPSCFSRAIVSQSSDESRRENAGVCLGSVGWAKRALHQCSLRKGSSVPTTQSRAVERMVGTSLREMRGIVASRLSPPYALSCSPPGLASGEPDDRLQRASSIPEASVLESIGRGVLGRPVPPTPRLRRAPKPGDDAECYLTH
jgi:hypothetical protein